MLRLLFAQFLTGEADAEAKFAGYVIALADASHEAVQAAVRSYLRGEVADHDGRFLPSSAELAMQVRREQQHLNRINPNAPLLVSSSEPEFKLSPEIIAKRLEKLERLKRTLDETIAATSFGD